MKNFIYVLLGLVILTSASFKKHTLQLNLKEGSEYRHNFKTSMVVNQDVMGQSMSTTMDITTHLVYKVISAEKDLYELSVRYEEISTEMKLPQTTMSFSSAEPKEGDMLSTILSKMVDESFTIKLDRRGKVIEVNGLQSMVANVFDNIKDGRQTQLQQMRTQFETSYGEDAIITNMEAATAIFPEEKVKVGDKWQVKRQMTSQYDLEITTEYELLEFSDEFAVVKGVSSLKTINNEQFVETNGMMVKFSMKGSMNSELKFDPNSGWIISADIMQEMKGNTEIEPSPQAPEGMSIPMSVTTTIKM